MRRPTELTSLYAVVCERYPRIPRAIKGKLAAVAKRLLGADLCDREACVRSIHKAIDLTAAEYE